MSTENIKIETDPSPKPPTVDVGSLARGSESFSMQFPTNIRAKSGPMKDRTFMPICCGSRERLAGFAEGIFSVDAMELADFNRVMKAIEK